MSGGLYSAPPPRSPRTRFGTRTTFLLIALLLLVSSLPGWAGPLIDVREINAVLESVVVDLDLTMFGLYFGSDPASALQYRSWVGLEGWTGILSGTYLGGPLELTYEGIFTPGLLPSDPAFISYTSTGTWGGEIWSGQGTAQYLDPEYGYQISPLQGTISGSISGQVGVFNVSLTGEKNFFEQQLKAEMSAGLIGVGPLGNLFEAGGGFRLSQTSGKDESYVFARILFGLIERERTLDRTRLWRPPQPPPPRQPPPPQPPPHRWPPYNSEQDYPGVPSGGTPGFDPSNPSSGAYHHMYVGNGYPVPEPASLLLAPAGLITLAGLARRRRSRA
jgi:hypothetical protein